MKNLKPDTEIDSLYSNLEKMSTLEMLTNINAEDSKIAKVVKQQIPIIEKLVDAIVPKMKNGGRLFYIGAGTSGRIGVLDASECPPTFGVSDGIVIGIIAGGDTAIRKAVENAEDNIEQAWKDLQVFNINENDVVIGLAASGNTPYVVGGLQKAKENNLITGAIYCNSKGLLSEIADYSIELVVGPEFLTGSSRMKAGTSQKLVLNMISTSVMIKLGRVKGNKMVDMQLSNKKLVNRGAEMIVDELNIDIEKATELLKKYGSVRQVLAEYKNEIQ
jgi:N-acetylmuramic acid 6-phosphate etherase